MLTVLAELPWCTVLWFSVCLFAVIEPPAPPADPTPDPPKNPPPASHLKLKDEEEPLEESKDSKR